MGSHDAITVASTHMKSYKTSRQCTWRKDFIIYVYFVLGMFNFNLHLILSIQIPNGKAFAAS
jgi:hypothetical protein